MWEREETTGYSVLDLANQDIDVSYDGETWFHMGGFHCSVGAKKRLAP